MNGIVVVRPMAFLLSGLGRGHVAPTGRAPKAPYRVAINHPAGWVLANTVRGEAGAALDDRASCRRDSGRVEPQNTRRLLSGSRPRAPGRIWRNLASPTTQFQVKSWTSVGLYSSRLPSGQSWELAPAVVRHGSDVAVQPMRVCPFSFSIVPSLTPLAEWSRVGNGAHSRTCEM